MSLSVNAQLCQGSLGDPVVNITFGQGANPGPALIFPTNYGFVTNDCPNDGFYTIRNNTTSCFGNSWHSLTKDHTGDPNGYFMLVNASLFPGIFYADTVHELCSNTTFEFASWVINVLKPTACLPDQKNPNLTFSIETTGGNTLKTFITNTIYTSDVPTWKQYGFFFQTPAGVSDVVVRIKNNAPGGCGNDLALDDITFRPCGPTIKAVINGEGTINEKSICDYDSKSYTLTGSVSAGFSNPAYQWQLSTDNINWSDISAATTSSYVRKPTVQGTYYYRMASAELENIASAKCRVASNVIKFIVEGRPTTSTSSNSPACESSTLTLTASGGSTYAWTGPNNFSSSLNPATINNVTQAAKGKYYVTVTSAAGCTQNDFTVVSIVPKPFVNAGNDVGVCKGNSTTLHATGANNYSWYPAAGLSATDIANPAASPADSTVYTVTTKDNVSGCTATDSVVVFVYDYPTANAGPDKAIIEGNSIMLNGSVAGTAISYNWTPPVYMNDANLITPVVFPPRDTTYTLHTISSVGCGNATDNVFVKVYKRIDVPNAFSPNHDGINDTWQIPALSAYPDAVVSVFNRYGKAVFTSKGNYSAWNGTYNNSELPIGTYYYVIDPKAAINLPMIKGSVTILR